MKGAFRCALRTALEEVTSGVERHSDIRVIRGWKLFLLLPRLLLYRPSRGGHVPRKQLEARMQQFQFGNWVGLLEDSQSCNARAHQSSVRRRRRDQVIDVEKRAARALSLVRQGELSYARLALEGAEVAPGNLATLRELTNPEKRPPRPRRDLSQEVVHNEPAAPFELDQVEFLVCLRTARRGGSSRASGMTADHIFPLLESEHDSRLFCDAASALARGEIPEEILSGFRLGRLTALRKPDGGVRGIVVGEILRRLIARSIAKQMPKSVEAATAPFQYALSTKAGCECVAHILQTLTDQDGQATVLSIDGIGAYDLLSRSAMLEGLLRMDRGDEILPFVGCFHGSPSTYLWEDEMGMSHEIAQGEQGDLLMPMLFALGLHPLSGQLKTGCEWEREFSPTWTMCT